MDCTARSYRCDPRTAYITSPFPLEFHAWPGSKAAAGSAEPRLRAFTDLRYVIRVEGCTR
jgi:hypothetical protein